MEQRNLLLAVVMSVSILLGWQFLFEQPQLEKELAAQKLAQQQSITAQPPQPSAPGAPTAPAPGATGAQVPSPSAPIAGQAVKPMAPVRQSIIGASTRVNLHSPRLRGSIRLKGALIDDLTLLSYRETTDPDSKQITLLSPVGAALPYYAQFGWAAAGADVAVPNDNTKWTANKSTLAPGK
ncbi:MAG: membrane protein insertase YidC, partial [Alphaproteobacteria bacterium]